MHRAPFLHGRMRGRENGLFCGPEIGHHPERVPLQRPAIHIWIDRPLIRWSPYLVESMLLFCRLPLLIAFQSPSDSFDRKKHPACSIHIISVLLRSSLV